MSRPPTVRRPRWLLRSSQPAAVKSSQSFSQGRSGSFGCADGSSAREVPRRIVRLGRVQVVGAEHEGPRPVEQRPESSRERARPTAGGDGVSGVDHQMGIELVERRIQDRSRLRPGVRCVSEMCSTRSGAEPGGRTGTSYWRRANQPARPPRVADRSGAEGGGDRERVRSLTVPWCHEAGMPLTARSRGPVPRMGLWLNSRTGCART